MTTSLTDREIAQHSKHLSWLLRHGARESALAMDAAGWVRVADLIALTRLDAEGLERVVADNNKARLQRDGDRIRACQGHSAEGVPVTREALEASWERWPGDAPVWHGTSVDAARAIAASGAILPGARTHVHLADERASKVGKRAGVAVVLGASPARLRAAGRDVWRSPNGVLLVRDVPVGSVVHVESATAAGDAVVAELRQLFGAVP